MAVHRAGWDPQPGLALVRLAQGDAATAAASIRDALERPLPVLPLSDHRTPTCSAPLLEAQVEIEIATGEIGRARSAADELVRRRPPIPEQSALLASALARGRRARHGDPAGAEQSLSEAVRLWNEVGAPYEAAVARMGLAEAHRASGSEHRAALERQAARTILDGIHAAPSLASPGHVGEHHDDARDEQPDASINVFRREGDYHSVSFEGHIVRVRNLKGMRYLARICRSGPGSTTCWTWSPPSPAAVPSQTAAKRPAWLPALGDAGGLDTCASATPIADAWPRSRTTSSKPAPSATPNGPRRPTPSARISWSGETRARARVGWSWSTSRIRVRARSCRGDPGGPPA